jgi:uncharacterized membrane protein YraQ (UPF0718 family)
MEKKLKIKKSIYDSGKNLLNAIPLIIAFLLLISFISQIFTKEFYVSIFTESFLDVLIGSLIGSISAGAPIISYIIGGEMIKQGVSLFAVTAFIISWVSVGVLSFPIEAHYLGKKFSFIRNSLSFIFSIIIALITVTIFNLI